MRHFGSLIILFFYSFLSYAQSEATLETAVNGFNSVAQQAGWPPVTCSSDRNLNQEPIEVSLDGDPNLYHKKVKLSGEWPKETLSFEGDEISILSEEQAQSLFQQFSRIEYMKFDYLHDGCFDRAHEFALIAKEHGIEMGKVFLSDKDETASLYPKEWLGKEDAPVPQGFVGWRYHVTPYVLVKKGDKLVPFAFDVGVSEKAKSLDEWQKDLNPRNEPHETIFRERGFLFKDSRWEIGDKSSIADQMEDQQMIRELGIDEFLFRREQGWI